MRQLIVLALVGFAAQLVDGSLGMGYGVTTTTLLLLAGMTPAAASASVHLSELGTNLASGISHWRLQNVDWRVVARIAVPGAIGAFLGGDSAVCSVDGSGRPHHRRAAGSCGCTSWCSFIVGIKPVIKKAITMKKLVHTLKLVAGFVDATGR